MTNLNDSVLANINTLQLVVGVVIGVLISYFSSKKYINTNDFKKSIRLSIILSTIAFIILEFSGLPLFVCIMLWLCTQIITAIYSNYYFYN